MPRIRTIKPEFFKNEQVSELEPMCRLLFIGLWTQADREGRLEDRPKRLKVEIFPYDTFDVESALNVLQSAGLIYRYATEVENSEVRFIKIITFNKHQQPNIREAQSVIPEPVNIPVQYKYSTGTVLSSQEGKGTGKEQERKGKEGDIETYRFSPPLFADVFDYFISKKNKTGWADEKSTIQAEKFIDHYTSNGWKVGKNKMSSWKAAASGWINREKEFSDKKSVQINSEKSSPPKPERKSFGTWDNLKK